MLLKFRQFNESSTLGMSKSEFEQILNIAKDRDIQTNTHYFGYDNRRDLNYIETNGPVMY